MARVILTTVLFVMLAMPVMAETTSDPNHKGYTVEKETFTHYVSKEKLKYTHFNAVSWKEVKTECKPCEPLVKQYNVTVKRLFKARTQVARLKHNTTREGIERIKGETGDYSKDNIHAEAAKLGAVLEFVDLSKENLPKAEQLVANLEILKEELRGQIADCEKQCSGKEREIIIKDPKALVLPYDWKGPYVTNCPQKCQKLADYLNGYPARTYPLLAEKRLLEAEVAQLKMDIQLYRLGAWSARTDDFDIRSMERDLKYMQTELQDVNAKIDKIKRGFKMDLDAFNKCEKECKPAKDPIKEPVKTGCVFPDNRPAIAIGPNNEVGSGKQFENKLKDQAKGAAMGALGGMLGGSGVSIGGGGSDGGGSSSQEPKLDKDPTSGSFENVSAGGVDLAVRIGLNDEGFVVSAKIKDAPGDGTFHAMWLEDGQGKVYLPRRYLLIDIYRDWKLSVWWDYKRWRDGNLVEHRSGDSLTVGTDYIGTLALFEGAKGIAKSIWNSLGFGTAVKGAKHIGAVFPASAVKGPCSPLKLVTHISLPNGDPVMTQVVTADIDVSSIGQASPMPPEESPKKGSSNTGSREGESKGAQRVRERASSHNE